MKSKNERLTLWSDKKKLIHAARSKFFPKTGQIYYTQTGENIGYELNGKNERFTRPVLILKKISPNNSICLPLSTKYNTKNQEYRYELSSINFIPKKSYVILNQPQTLDHRRFYLKLGNLPKNIFEQIKNRSAEQIFGG